MCNITLPWNPDKGVVHCSGLVKEDEYFLNLHGDASWEIIREKGLKKFLCSKFRYDELVLNFPSPDEDFLEPRVLL